jgi:hypothetical protein
MKAKFLSEQSNARNLSGDKELVDSFKVVAYYKGQLTEVVTCRVWMGRSRNASTVYASVWVHAPAKNVHSSGYGSANGYGYCKTSAAIGEAIRSAGFQLDQRIDGTGCHREALEAIAHCVGYRKILTVAS